MFTPKYIESRLYRTPMQRARRFWQEPKYREAVYIGVIIALALVAFTNSYAKKVDSNFIKTYEQLIDNQRITPQTTTGILIQPATNNN